MSDPTPALERRNLVRRLRGAIDALGAKCVLFTSVRAEAGEQSTLVTALVDELNEAGDPEYRLRDFDVLEAPAPLTNDRQSVMIIDGPSSDSGLLDVPRAVLDLVDTSVIVVNNRSCRADELKGLREWLAGVGAPVIGVIFDENAIPRRGWMRFGRRAESASRLP